MSTHLGAQDSVISPLGHKTRSKNRNLTENQSRLEGRTTSMLWNSFWGMSDSMMYRRNSNIPDMFRTSFFELFSSKKLCSIHPCRDSKVEMSCFESPKTRQKSRGPELRFADSLFECSKMQAELFSHKLFELFCSNEYLQHCLLCFRSPFARRHEDIKIVKVKNVKFWKLDFWRKINILKVFSHLFNQLNLKNIFWQHLNHSLNIFFSVFPPSINQDSRTFHNKEPA